MEVALCEYEEYRFEVGETQKFKIMLMSGTAEIKGQELISEKWYLFKNIKTFIFTYHGCKIKIDGACELQYVSKNTNVPTIFKLFISILHGHITDKVFLVMGNGRTTFCVTLINYFLRVHNKVLFTEIDLKKGNIFPGSLSSVYVDTLVGYNDHIKLQNTLSYFYGSTEIRNEDLYYKQLQLLNDAIQKKNIDSIHIILAPDDGNDYYTKVCKIFSVDKIICLGDERRYHRLDIDMSKMLIECSGYIKEDTVATSMSRYFNGTNNEYTPYSYNIKHKWGVLRVGEDCLAPESALPLGSTRKLDTLEVKEVELLNNCILGISESATLDDVINKPVLGYCVVINQDTFKLLCIQPKLPKYSFFIQGDLKYLDS